MSPWLGLFLVVPVAAYLAVKGEGSRIWTALSAACWTIVSIVILGALGLLFGLGIAALKSL